MNEVKKVWVRILVAHADKYNVGDEVEVAEKYAKVLMKKERKGVPTPWCELIDKPKKKVKDAEKNLKVE